MLFNSFTFLLFLAVVLTLHRALPSSRSRKGLLLLSSYLFYAAWNPPFVVLVWISTVVDWIVARRLHASPSQRGRRLWLLLSLGANLGLLGYFKYAGFVLENFVRGVQSLGIDYQPAAPDIVLPVGISFYTFQTLSYTIDVYRRRMGPWHSFLDYALYVTFFPQLVAGPIVRATTFLPQCIEPALATARQMGWGFALLTVGLFEKVVVADGLLAPTAEWLYGSSEVPTRTAAWCGTLAFSGQIFCDFAGYSSCAIGVALLFGFRLPDNFRFPYAAVGFSDFWRRWHISLSTWLRDYLYIPLGGNRRGPSRTQLHLMITMLLGGLWHGASWNFVVWGALHGVYLVVERLLRVFVPPWQLWSRAPVQGMLALSTFVCVCVTWVFFRADDFPQAFAIVRAMMCGGGALYPSDSHLWIPVLTVGAILVAHFPLRNTSLEQAAERTPWWLRAGILAAMLAAIVLSPGEDRAFLYFQF